MTVSRILLFVAVIAIASAWAVLPVYAQEEKATKSAGAQATRDKLSFENDIVPILEVHCVECHGQKARKGELDVRRRFTMAKGGESGPAIVPGEPDESLLIEQIEAGEMPPEDEKPLDEKQRELLRRWIAVGAPIAGEKEKPLDDAEEIAWVTDEDREYWAFQPPVRPPVPAVEDDHRVGTPIDAFLLAKLEEKGLTFNPDAAKLVLLRRLYFDLHGLPPTPQQIDAFIDDDRSDAYERLVDQLLDAEHYGERWGRHWLDVAGYADSDGYLNADRLRPEAWRYRDYVIRALNQDKPFDQFLREQIAGDELTDWRRADELTPDMIEKLVATGFLRTAADPTYPGYTEPNECHKVMSDTIEILSSALLGLTMKCARCHSHKYDPISQRDYYGLHAIFLASYDPQQWIPSTTRHIPMASESQQTAFKDKNKRIDEQVKNLNAQLAALTKRYAEKFLAQKLNPESWQAVKPDTRDKLIAALLVDAKKQNDAQKKLLAEYAPGISFTTNTLEESFPDYQKDNTKLRTAIADEQALQKKIVEIRGLMDLDDQPRQAHVLLRGEHDKPGATIEPAVPVVLAKPSFKLQPQSSYKTTGRRRAFAEWLTDPEHPLTARIQVNRIWARHFGRGLVETVADFGHTGSRPSHPELLDWLATEFIRQDWSLKQLHRLMLTSTAYRQTSALDTQKAAQDPENILLGSWRPKRHDGEVVRDTLLAAAGKLNLRMHGPPAPVKREATGAVVTGDDPQGNRRSIYLIVRRSQHVTFLDTFDTPKMETNCPKRTESIVPQQALEMMNGPFAGRNAGALAERIWQLAPAGRDARIDAAYRLLFSRPPVAAEREFVAEFLEAFAQETFGDKHPTATAAEKEATYRSGWKQVALVLLNTNEFLYVH